MHNCTWAASRIFCVHRDPIWDLPGSARPARSVRAHRERHRFHGDANLSLSDRDHLGLRLRSQCLADRTEPHLAQRPLPARRRGQERREHRVHGQHHAYLGHESSRSRQIYVIYTAACLLHQSHPLDGERVRPVNRIFKVA
jgi:hypothetical protein